MSDLAKLFHLCNSGQRPLENFTSAALAIAIGHDDGPIKRAVRSLRTDGCPDDDLGALGKLAELASSPDTRATAVTQVWLPRRDATPTGGAHVPEGYLDLVLTFTSPTGESVKAWVEVKVDAWEGKNQLEKYREHAAPRQPKPVVMTLGRSRVRADTAHLGWAELVEAVRECPTPHYTWQSLGEFLAERWVVRPPLPPHPIEDPTPYLKVVVSVNGQIRSLWPDAGNALAWQDGRLRSALEKAFKERHDLQGSGGPLYYGLVSTSSRWEWVLEVRVKNDERVRLQREDFLRAAESGGLSNEWARHGDGREALSRSLPLGAANQGHEVLEWFDQGLRQLRDARILEPYLSGYRARYGKGKGAAAGPVREG